MRDRERIAAAVLRKFPEKKVMVIGDLIVDEYVTGSVRRISPEAPVPVLYYQETDRKAGGASNVAHNLHTLGCRVCLAGVAGEDGAGRWLRRYMEAMSVETRDIIPESGRNTIVKTRVATKGQQLLRIDREKTGSIGEQTKQGLLAALQSRVPELDAVILSDYQKGVLDDAALTADVIRICKEHRILVAVDSKSHRIGAFRGADFVKPNNLELEEAVGFRIANDADMDRAGNLYLEQSGAGCLIVTRGHRGISVFRPGVRRMDFPAIPAQVYDVTGAGDTVISTIVLGLASGLLLEEAVRLANVAAAIVIGKVGTAAVTGKELIEKVYEEQDCGTGCAD